MALLPEIERFQDAGLNVVVIDLESTKGDEGVRPALSAGDVELVSTITFAWVSDPSALDLDSPAYESCQP